MLSGIVMSVMDWQNWNALSAIVLVLFLMAYAPERVERASIR